MLIHQGMIEAQIEDYIDPTGRLRPHRFEDVLFEITSGRHVWTSSDGSFCASRTPNLAELEQARLMYVCRFHEVRQSSDGMPGLMTREEIEKVCLSSGVLDPKERREKVTLISAMEAIGKSREMSNSNEQKLGFDTQLVIMQKRLTQILEEEATLFAHSAEVDADTWRQSYLVSQCTCGGPMLQDKIWPTWEDFLNSSAAELIWEARQGFLRVTRGLPVPIIRAVARFPQWRSIWKTSKETSAPLFDGSSVSWDHNKRTLIWWSDFYDNVYSHQDCPPEETINNDEALQLWVNNILEQKKKAKAQQGSVGGGQKVFFRDGHGNRKQMNRVGGHNVAVNQGYKIRSKYGS